MNLAERFGVDALRYYLLREVSFGQDGSYSAEAIVRTANADLANSFGNLAQRSLSMIFKNLDGKLSVDYQVAPEDEALLADILDMARVRLPREFEQLAFSAGIEDWRSEEHTSELQSLMRISYAVFCLNKKNYSNTPPS